MHVLRVVLRDPGLRELREAFLVAHPDLCGNDGELPPPRHRMVMPRLDHRILGVVDVVPAARLTHREIHEIAGADRMLVGAQLGREPFESVILERCGTALAETPIPHVTARDRRDLHPLGLRRRLHHRGRTPESAAIRLRLDIDATR